MGTGELTTGCCCADAEVGGADFGALVQDFDEEYFGDACQGADAAA